jgi:inosine-uridine nucleoside N-ribohydrolase
VTDLTDKQRADRAHLAKRALDEFLDPAFELLADTYAQRIEDLASTAPWEAGKITALANALRIAKEVRSQIQIIVMDGRIAQSNIDRTERLEKLTPAKRRLLSIGF